MRTVGDEPVPGPTIPNAGWGPAQDPTGAALGAQPGMEARVAATLAPLGAGRRYAPADGGRGAADTGIIDMAGFHAALRAKLDRARHDPGYRAEHDRLALAAMPGYLADDHDLDSATDEWGLPRDDGIDWAGELGETDEPGLPIGLRRRLARPAVAERGDAAGRQACTAAEDVPPRACGQPLHQQHRAAAASPSPLVTALTVMTPTLKDHDARTWSCQDSAPPEPRLLARLLDRWWARGVVGEPQAAFDYGRFLEGTPYRAAADVWLVRAASNGHPDAAARLGHRFEVQHDPVRAARWYYQAHAAGSELGSMALARIAYERGENDGAALWLARAWDTDPATTRTLVQALVHPRDRLADTPHRCRSTPLSTVREYLARLRIGLDAIPPVLPATMFTESVMAQAESWVVFVTCPNTKRRPYAPNITDAAAADPAGHTRDCRSASPSAHLTEDDPDSGHAPWTRWQEELLRPTACNDLDLWTQPLRGPFPPAVRPGRDATDHRDRITDALSALEQRFEACDR